MYQRPLAIAATILTTLFAVTTAHAAIVFAPGALKGGVYTVASEGEHPARLAYEIQFADLTGEISKGKAEIHLTESINGPEKPTAAVLLLPIAPGIDAKSVSVRLKEKGVEKEIATRFLSMAETQTLVETIAKKTGDVRFIPFSGSKLAVANVSLQGKMEFQIDFTAAATNVNDVSSLALPISAAELASGPIERVDARLTLKSDLPQRLIFSPSHEVAVDRNGLFESVIRLKATQWTGNEDFRLLWVADRADLGLRVLTYRESEKEDGYFMVVGNPTGGGDTKPIPKDVVFVLDTSGSMRGEKIEQCRASIEYCLTQLQAEDRFNIVTFGTDVTSFAERPVSIEASNLTRAQNFVEDIIAQGKTNIEGALKAALTGGDGAATEAEGRPRMVIFLTDGVPTAGELRPDKIVENIAAWNSLNARVFVMGAGNDVNAHLLDKIAAQTEGSSEYIIPQEEIDAKVAALYNRLANPVLTNVYVEFGDLNVSSQYPEKVGPLFRNSEVMLLGRFQDSGKQTVVIRGELNGEPKSFECRVDFPAKATHADSEFVAPLWAARNIGYLLQQIRLHGEDEELLKEVVRLSKKFGIVTEYTSFLGNGGAALNTEELQNEVSSRLMRANQIQTGKWAVQQARNDIGLQNRAVVNYAANCYFDRRGEKVVANNIRQIGAGCFFLNDGQWVDSNDAGKRKERNVELFSDEYFTLLRSNDAFRRAQQLGWAMSLNVGDERIVIVKDGKHQSEELLKKAPPIETQQNEYRNRGNFGNQFQQRGFPQLQQNDLNQLNRNVIPRQVPNVQQQIELPQNLAPANRNDGN